MLSGEDEDGNITFDDALPAPKRSRSSYGLEVDVPLTPFYHRMESAAPQVCCSTMTFAAVLIEKF